MIKLKDILNEAFTKGTIYGGNLKIDGKKVPVEVVLMGADKKKNAFIAKVLHIDKKYYSKLPPDGILYIPARIFRVPGGGWYKVKVPKVFEDKIPGGLASGMSLSDIAKKHNVSIEEITQEFKKGIKVEMEHTTDKEIAKEIAKDHIYEDPKYYTKLSTIETNEDLRKWFGKGKTGSSTGGGWDRYSTTGKNLGKCGDAKDGEPYSACLSQEKAKKLGKKGIANFVKRKRAAQKKAGDAKKGGEQKKGQKPTYVKTGA